MERRDMNLLNVILSRVSLYEAMRERYWAYWWFVVMIHVIAIGSQPTLLVVRLVAGHTLICRQRFVMGAFSLVLVIEASELDAMPC